MEVDYLQSYKDYYRIRAERFANNPNYRFSYEAESNLSNAMQSCSELSEFRDRIGNLNELCAIALIKDEHIMEQTFYEKHKETVRVLAAERILTKVDKSSDTTELMTLVMEEINKNSVEISMDEFQRKFQEDWFLMDNIEVYENAVVPGSYQADFQYSADEIKASIIKGSEDSELEGRKFDPNYVMKPEMNLEHRHRRLIPYSDQHLEEQMAKYKSLINR